MGELTIPPLYSFPLASASVIRARWDEGRVEEGNKAPSKVVPPASLLHTRVTPQLQ